MLPDMQNQRDTRRITLDEVGISHVRYPTEFVDGQLSQGGIGDFDVVVSLPADRRGTHMSRMVEVVHDYLQRLDPRELLLVLKHAAAKLEVDDISIRVSLAVATPVMSPASELSSFQASDVRLDARLNDGAFALSTTVTSQVTSLCPCSKAISDYGAHNQRSDVSLTVVGDGNDPYPLGVAQAVDLIRSIGSCPVYPLVKRPDERAITMAAYEHPAFVEDMVRDLSVALRRLGLSHSVSVRNLESIHSHDAVATVVWAPSAHLRP